MALTNQQKADLLTLYQNSAALQTLVQAAGINDVIDGMRDLYASQRQQSAVTALTGNVSVTVADWPALEAFLASGLAAPAAIEITKKVGVAVAARNASALGPGLVALYAAVKAHFSLP